MTTITDHHHPATTHDPERWDPLLATLEQLARQQQETDRRMRLLVAYARECTGPRPYRLADLAQASGWSISGIRSAYTPAHVAEVTRLLGALDQDSTDSHESGEER